MFFNYDYLQEDYSLIISIDSFNISCEICESVIAILFSQNFLIDNNILREGVRG